jgi:hypothetical protein
MQNRIAHQRHFLIFQESIAIEAAFEALIVDELKIGIVPESIGDGIGERSPAGSKRLRDRPTGRLAIAANFAATGERLELFGDARRTLPACRASRERRNAGGGRRFCTGNL